MIDWTKTPPSEDGWWWVRGPDTLRPEAVERRSRPHSTDLWWFAGDEVGQDGECMSLAGYEFWPERIEPPGSIFGSKPSPETIASMIVDRIDSTQMAVDARRPWENPNQMYLPSAGYLWQRIVDVLHGRQSTRLN